MEVHREPFGSDIVCGLRLVAVNRIDLGEEDHLEIVERLLSAIDGHTSVRLILQTFFDPVPTAPQRGRITIHLFVVAPQVVAAELDELVEDLLDFLSTPPHAWTFEPIVDAGSFSDALNPIEARHFAEIVRREEACPAPDLLPPVGYLVDDSDDPSEDLWSMWRFDAGDRTDAAIMLLSQDSPIVIRTILSATRLTPPERELLENLVEMTGVEARMHGIRAASGRVFERMLVSIPLYEARTLVASSESIGVSVLSAIGWSISPPQDGDTSGLLTGGFEALRGDEKIAGSWVSLGVGGVDSHEADGVPSVRHRIRRVLTMTEAATAFGLPRPAQGGSPGIRSTRMLVERPPIGDLPSDGTLLGTTQLGSDTHEVRFARGDRMRHLYVTGQTGTGKSTLMGNLILDDIECGAGVAVVDPHGSLVQSILERIPEERIDDVIVIEPADTEAVVGVNLLEAESEAQQTFVVSELAAMFYSLFDPAHTGIVGPRYESWLRQAAHLLLANPDRPSSMLDIPTIYTDDAVRRLLVDGMNDVVLAEFWRGEIAQTSDYHKSEMLGWFRSKFEVFRMSAPVRRIVGQAKSTISFDDAMAEGRIILVNLSKGYLGSYNANLIGFVVLTRLWQATLGRIRLPEDQRSDFFIYIDEFQNLTTNSLAEMLSEARKFRVGVTLANQFLGQVPEDIQFAIMGNVSTKVLFRLGPADASLFASWMGSGADAEDFTHLKNFTAMAALANQGEPLDPLVLNAPAMRGSSNPDHAERVRARSRELWAKPVDDVDRAFAERWADVEGSFAHRMANPPETHERTHDSGSSSFLDEWLEKRRAAHGDSSEESDSDDEPSPGPEIDTDGEPDAS